MKISVARRYRFGAFHSLPGFSAPWCDLHRHDYTVEVVAAAEDPIGIIIDTDDLDRAWSAFAPEEGVVLNLAHDDTTVEGLAREWLEAFRSVYDCVASVTVWEDDGRWGRAE